MNHNPQPHHQPDEHDAELDQFLLKHLGPAPNAADHLIPSSGFAQSVMDAVHQQATAPPPIPFPWKRLLPSAIALLCALLAFAFLFISRPTPSFTNTISLNLALSDSTVMTASLIALVIAISLVTTAISFKLSTGRFRN
jgi:hypothetical protein